MTFTPTQFVPDVDVGADGGALGACHHDSCTAKTDLDKRPHSGRGRLLDSSPISLPHPVARHAHPLS